MHKQIARQKNLVLSSGKGWLKKIVNKGEMWWELLYKV
jgi:hypothetical protein